ncbi:MAG: hypothetical protein C5B55_11180 [Blastocatellia bacterium]|nr:MAG: hypothetical protein C5B55_11180 [Blastocatellia bacterium]
MSTQDTRILFSIPQFTFFERERKNSDGFNYLFGRIFRCWHRKMSRPFTRDTESYRACLRCGMRRNFDLKTWRSTGRFYTPSVKRGLKQ